MSGEYREYSSEDKRRLDRLGLDSNRYKGNYSADEVEEAYRNQLDKPMSGLEQDALYHAYGALKSKAPREHIGYSYESPKKSIFERCLDAVAYDSYNEAEESYDFEVPRVAKGVLGFIEDFVDEIRWRLLTSPLSAVLGYYCLMDWAPATMLSAAPDEWLTALLQAGFLGILGIALMLLALTNLFIPLLNGLIGIVIEVPVKMVVGLEYKLWKKRNIEEIK